MYELGRRTDARPSRAAFARAHKKALDDAGALVAGEWGRSVPGDDRAAKVTKLVVHADAADHDYQAFGYKILGARDLFSDRSVASGDS
jgi:hypothetical protein